MRAIYNTLPFNKILAWLVVEMAKASVFWLNRMPPKDSFGNKLSPRTIITGQKLDYNRHCRFQFGEYVQTHEQHDNSMNPQTVGALALCPTGNAQGSFYFMSISTGWVLNRLHATPLPCQMKWSTEFTDWHDNNKQILGYCLVIGTGTQWTWRAWTQVRAKMMKTTSQTRKSLMRNFDSRG